MSELKPCQECGMLVEPNEFHPFAVCLMYKGCGNHNTVRMNMSSFTRTTDKELDACREALRDLLSGWKYIRDSYGDLYGVGWDRAQNKAEQALNSHKKEMSDE